MKICAVLSLLIMVGTHGAYAQFYSDLYLSYNDIRIALDDSVSQLGKPEQTVQEMDSVMQKELTRTFFRAGFSVYNLNEGDDKIVRIRIVSPSMILSNGIHTGMTADLVVKIIGKPSNVAVFGGRRTYSYWYYSASSNPMMVLIVYLGKNGVVEELELGLPLI